MEDFRNKLVIELEEFNKNVDEALKKAGEIRLERESEYARDMGQVIDLERETKDERDVFTHSQTKFDFKNKQATTDRQAIPNIDISQDDLDLDEVGLKKQKMDN